MIKARRTAQHPRIVRSDLTTPARWFVVTKYKERKGLDPTTQEAVAYLVAAEKFDVTDQMQAILKAARAR